MAEEVSISSSKFVSLKYHSTSRQASNDDHLLLAEAQRQQKDQMLRLLRRQQAKFKAMVSSSNSVTDLRPGGLSVPLKSTQTLNARAMHMQSVDRNSLQSSRLEQVFNTKREVTLKKNFMNLYSSEAQTRVEGALVNFRHDKPLDLMIDSLKEQTERARRVREDLGLRQGSSLGLDGQERSHTLIAGDHESSINHDHLPVESSFLQTGKSLNTSKSPRPLVQSGQPSIDVFLPSQMSINASVSTNVHSQKLMVEAERKKIEKLMKQLDQKELQLASQSCEEELASAKFSPALDYFTALQHSLRSMFLDKRGSVTVNEDDSKVIQKGPQSLYSKSLVHFIENLCQGMSICKSYFQKTLVTQAALKDKVIEL